MAKLGSRSRRATTRSRRASTRSRRCSRTPTSGPTTSSSACRSCRTWRAATSSSCLLHEKPFAGVNGSSKHNNWSFGTDTGVNLPNRATRRTRTSSSCSSARRCSQPSTRRSCCAPRSPPRPGPPAGRERGAPAIISIFLGAELQKVYDAIESGSGDAATPSSYLKLGASVLPHLPMHGGDRNRTSPFAFTGNKFEFRAPAPRCRAGSRTRCSTRSPRRPSTDVRQAGGAARERRRARRGRARGRQGGAAHKRIVFNGDNYSEGLALEAEQRGLANLPRPRTPCRRSFEPRSR